MWRRLTLGLVALSFLACREFKIPDALPCGEAGCGLPVIIGGINGGTLPDAGGGGGDASADATAEVGGNVFVLSRLPITAADGGTAPAAGWAVRVPDTMLATTTDDNGAFALARVPLVADAYFPLRAEPPSPGLASYTVFRTGTGASNLYGISQSNLQTSLFTAGITVLGNRGHVAVFVVDGIGPTARLVPGVRLSTGTESANIVYDDSRGYLTSSVGFTGTAGLALALNLNAMGTRTITLSFARGSATPIDQPVTIYDGTITWLSVLMP